MQDIGRTVPVWPVRRKRPTRCVYNRENDTTVGRGGENAYNNS